MLFSHTHTICQCTINCMYCKYIYVAWTQDTTPTLAKTKKSKRTKCALLTQTIFLSDVPATKRCCLSSSGWNLTQYGTFLLVNRALHWPANNQETIITQLHWKHVAKLMMKLDAVWHLSHSKTGFALTWKHQETIKTQLHSKLVANSIISGWNDAVWHLSASKPGFALTWQQVQTTSHNQHQTELKTCS